MEGLLLILFIVGVFKLFGYIVDGIEKGFEYTGKFMGILIGIILCLYLIYSLLV
jgi:hypothetical protein